MCYLYEVLVLCRVDSAPRSGPEVPTQKCTTIEFRARGMGKGSHYKLMCRVQAVKGLELGREMSGRSR